MTPLDTTDLLEDLSLQGPLGPNSDRILVPKPRRAHPAHPTYSGDDADFNSPPPMSRHKSAARTPIHTARITHL